MTNRDGKALFAWPPAIREAVIVKNPKILTLREQSLTYLIDRTVELGSYYKRIIDTFKAPPLNGKIYLDKDDEGREIPTQFIFELGTSTVLLECDDYMMPRRAVHAFDISADPVVPTSEASYISQVIEAVIYQNAPDKAKLKLEMGKKYLRNGHTVDGIGDLTDRLKAEPLLVQNAIGGANIEKEDVSDVSP